jgi:hypothetical protein
MELSDANLHRNVALIDDQHLEPLGTGGKWQQRNHYGEIATTGAQHE